MKITVAKIKRELINNHGQHTMSINENQSLINEVIKDTLKIVDKILKEQKGISIK